jgi:hypothetical protein
MMLQSANEPVDTSPKIAEYGKACATSNTGERVSATNCITEWYTFDPKQVGRLSIYYFDNNVVYPRNDANYQYVSEGGNRNWYYRGSNFTRTIGWDNDTLHQIRFTILTENIDDVYAYVVETGQIFFAGKHTPYYGYTNINDMH